MSPEQWGPPVWTLFHCLTLKIKPDSYPLIGKQLFSFIYRICLFLPCPECSSHAKQFLEKINFNTLKTKDDLKNIIYVFHNYVNKRKKKPMFDFALFDATYVQKNLVGVLNRFFGVYNTKGNMKLLAESFQRQILIKDFKKWIIQNESHFVL
jgi:hypothetical protein